MSKYTTAQLVELIRRSAIHDPEVAKALRWLCKFKVTTAAHNALKEENSGLLKAVKSLDARNKTLEEENKRLSATADLLVRQK